MNVLDYILERVSRGKVHMTLIDPDKQSAGEAGELAKIAVERDCGRMEWSVLNWNEPAIRFYRSLGAKPMDEWSVFRLTDDDIARLAAD